MIRFSLFGIPVQVQPFFWLSLAIIGGNFGADSSEALMRMALFVIAGFVSILVHELGHALTGRAFGSHSSITLQAFGGYAAFTGAPFTRPQNFLVTLAGPVVQALLGVIVMLVIANVSGFSENAKYFLVSLMLVSFIWALLNLLPVLPLDGGQLLHAILGPKRIRITLWTSIIVSLACAVMLYRMNPRWPIAPLFMGYFAWQSWQALREHQWR